LGEADPDRAGALQIIQAGQITVGGVVLGAAMRDQRAQPYELGRSVAEHLPEGMPVDGALVELLRLAQGDRSRRNPTCAALSGP
jgi:hypothetical protein